MITNLNNSTMEAPTVPEPISESNGGNSDGAGMGRLLHSFRYFIILAFLGSVFLPPLAYLSSPANGDAIPSPGEFYLRLGVYGAAALVMLVALCLLLLRLEPYLLKESLDQAAFLENIPDRFLAVAIAGSASL